MEEKDLSKFIEEEKGDRTMRNYSVIATDKVKEFIKVCEEKGDDAGHFKHDTKVVRIKDLKELAGPKLIERSKE